MRIAFQDLILHSYCFFPRFPYLLSRTQVLDWRSRKQSFPEGSAAFIHQLLILLQLCDYCVDVNYSIAKDVLWVNNRYSHVFAGPETVRFVNLWEAVLRFLQQGIMALVSHFSQDKS